MSTKKKKSARKVYPAEYKLKLVKLHLEEEYSYSYLHEQTGVGISTLGSWVKQYRTDGPDCFKQKIPAKKTPNKTLSEQPAVREKIIEIKQDYPVFGIQRISDLLKRVFFLKASPETVRKTLHEEELMPEKPRQKPKKNPQKPRFFERSKPNQMWQTDIFSFRLGGRQAYLLGFIDDYSRHIVGLGLYRSQTAENLLETYRRAVGEYGLPAEMLTDNGRQYTNWRGTTRFEKELQKDRIKHIKSQPHHPMTLGKIERFWKTIWDEFLNRCQFDSLESAQQRIALWIKYYNHRRPHQGIGGLCPADRFFEIDTKLREVIERGVEENTLELALRGRPKENFYMVGRMNGQSVVLEAEKGKGTMSLTVDERLDGKLKEELDNEKDNTNCERNQPTDNREENTSLPQQENLYRRAEMPGSFESVEFESERFGDLPRPQDKLQPVGQVANTGFRSYGRSLEAQSQRIETNSFEPEDSTPVKQDTGDRIPLTLPGGIDVQSRPESSEEDERNLASSKWSDHRDQSSRTTRSQSEDFSQLGEQGFIELARIFEGQIPGTTGEGVRPLCGRDREEVEESESAGTDAGTGTGDSRHPTGEVNQRFRRARRHPFHHTKKKF